MRLLSAFISVHRRPFMFLFLCSALSAQTYDIVLANGRVMDPESGLDAIRNVGIQGHTIAADLTATLQGRTTIDAKRDSASSPPASSTFIHTARTTRIIAIKRATASQPRWSWRLAHRPSPPGTRSAKERRSSISVRPPGIFPRA